MKFPFNHKKYFIKRYLRLILRVCIIFIGIILFKIFVADLYYIPTGSMGNTIKPRSYVILSKTAYGAILPNSTHEIPLISKILKIFPAKKLWNQKRIYGFKEINKGDIVVAKYKDFKIAKRIVGSSGDTIKIENAFVYINSQKEKILDSYLYKYVGEFTTQEAKKLKDKMEMTYLGSQSFEITVDGKMLKKIESEKLIAQSIDKYRLTIKKDTIFPKAMHKLWNENNYGPILIPYKGMKIELNQKNIELYGDIINLFENSTIKLDESQLQSGEKEPLLYIFENDYYFLMGDNRMESIDSRFIGFIPKKKILGKIIY